MTAKRPPAQPAHVGHADRDAAPGAGAVARISGAAVARAVELTDLHERYMDALSGKRRAAIAAQLDTLAHALDRHSAGALSDADLACLVGRLRAAADAIIASVAAERAARAHREFWSAFMVAIRFAIARLT